MPSVALSPDGQTLAWATKGILRLLHIQTARVLHTFSGTYFRVAFSPDGRFVAAPDRAVQKVYIWNAVEGTVRAVLSSPEVHALTWSPDGRMLAYGGGDGAVRLSDLSGNREPRRFEGHTALVRALAISPNGETLASGGADRTVRIWSIKTGRLLHELRGHDENAFGIYGLSFDQEGKLLASASPNMVRIWEVSSGQPRNAFPQDSCDILSLVWSPDGKMIAIGYFGQPGARILDPRSRLLSLFPPTPCGVRSLAWSGNSQVIAYGCGQGLLRLWSPGTGCLGGTLLSLRLKQWVAISPDGYFRGSPGVEQELVYVVETDQGQETLTPQEFTDKYGWENESDKVRLWPSAETLTPSSHNSKEKGERTKRAES
jgi:WD40 repeat protein